MPHIRIMICVRCEFNVNRQFFYFVIPNGRFAACGLCGVLCAGGSFTAQLYQLAQSLLLVLMDNAGISNKRILIIDDDLSNTEVISLILKSHGYDVLVLNEHISIENISRAGPDLILLDILLSGTDGRDICKQIKASADLSLLPVILLSAVPHLDAAATAAGATDFVMKPFDMDELIDKINRYI